MPNPFRLSVHVDCPVCQQPAGQGCRDENGVEMDDHHHRRTNAMNAALRTGNFLVRLNQDLPESGLVDGQVIEVTSHPSDPGSYIVLQPAGVGSIPTSNASFVSFADTSTHGRVLTS